jgi:hypothetical protein
MIIAAKTSSKGANTAAEHTKIEHGLGTFASRDTAKLESERSDPTVDFSHSETGKWSVLPVTWSS